MVLRNACSVCISDSFTRRMTIYCRDMIINSVADSVCHQPVTASSIQACNFYFTISSRPTVQPGLLTVKTSDSYILRSRPANVHHVQDRKFTSRRKLVLSPRINENTKLKPIQFNTTVLQRILRPSKLTWEIVIKMF